MRSFLILTVVELLEALSYAYCRKPSLRTFKGDMEVVGISPSEIKLIFKDW